MARPLVDPGTEHRIVDAARRIGNLERRPGVEGEGFIDLKWANVRNESMSQAVGAGATADVTFDAYTSALEDGVFATALDGDSNAPGGGIELVTDHLVYVLATIRTSGTTIPTALHSLQAYLTRGAASSKAFTNAGANIHKRVPTVGANGVAYHNHGFLIAARVAGATDRNIIAARWSNGDSASRNITYASLTAIAIAPIPDDLVVTGGFGH